MKAEHWLKSFRPVGHSLVQVIKEKGEAVAVVQWSSCAYHLKDREQWIGWNAMQCAQRRQLVVNNVRFLVRDCSPNLASKALAQAVEALLGQWREKYGYEPLLAETFTDPETHQGTCYKAAGWTPLGLTKGSRRPRAECCVPGQSRKSGPAPRNWAEGGPRRQAPSSPARHWGRQGKAFYHHSQL